MGPGRRIHYVDRGEGPAVVYFPGNGCCVDDFHLLIEDVARHFRFVGINPPGREPTEWPDEPFDFCRDLTVTVVPDAGHWMMLDDPDAVAASLLPFLERVHGRRKAGTPSSRSGGNGL